MATVAAGCGFRLNEGWGLGLCRRESQYPIGFEVSWDLSPFPGLSFLANAEPDCPPPPPFTKAPLSWTHSGPVKLRGNKIEGSL